MGFKQSTYQACLYYKYEADGRIILIGQYIDDLAICATEEKQTDDLIKELKKEYDIGTYTDLTWFLGLAITTDRKAKKITVSSEKYVRDIYASDSTWIKAQEHM